MEVDTYKPSKVKAVLSPGISTLVPEAVKTICPWLSGLLNFAKTYRDEMAAGNLQLLVRALNERMDDLETRIVGAQTPHMVLTEQFFAYV